MSTCLHNSSASREEGSSFRFVKLKTERCVALIARIPGVKVVSRFDIHAAQAVAEANDTNQPAAAEEIAAEPPDNSWRLFGPNR